MRFAWRGWRNRSFRCLGLLLFRGRLVGSRRGGLLGGKRVSESFEYGE
jgi:hypothetical protein